MLSFLREQGSGNSSVQQTDIASKAGQNEDVQQEYLTVATRNKSVRKSTMLLAVLFAVGLLCLWFMIKKSAPQSASAEVISSEELQIENAIAQLTGVKSEMFNRMDEIVKKFYEFSDVPQVEVNELVKNPFELEMFLADLARKKNLDIDADILRQQQLKQQANGMKLLCIIQSERGNCCMIKGQILYEGDFIEGFKVKKIDSNYVNLESEGVEIILKLSE